MVSIWETKQDEGKYVELQFKRGSKQEWVMFKFEFDDYGNKKRDDTREFELVNESRQSVKGHEIRYLSGKHTESIEEKDVLYFVKELVHSKTYSFTNTKKKDGSWKLSDLHVLPCRQSPMQLSIKLDNLDDPKKKIPKEEKLDGHYRFKPLKGRWWASKSSYTTFLRGEDLYGYDIEYRGRGGKDTLYVDRNGNIYSKNYSWAGDKKIRNHTYCLVQVHLLHTTILFLQIQQKNSQVQNDL